MPELIIKKPNTKLLKRGTWVAVETKDGVLVGICDGIGTKIQQTRDGISRFEFDPNMIEFHQVDDQGLTVEKLAVHISKVRFAKLSEIPAVRLEGRTAEELAVLGYED